MKFRRNNIKKRKVANREFPESFYIPYKHHFNERTIQLKDNSLMQVVKLSGFSFETADDEDIDVRKKIRNLLFKGIGASNVTLYFHILRRRRRGFEEKAAEEYHLKGFARDLDEFWRQKNRANKSFVNELYISIIKKTPKLSLDIVDQVIHKLQGSEGALQATASMDAYEELNEISQRIVTTFRDYKAEQLSAYKERGIIFCPIMEFLGKLVNCGSPSPMQVPTMSIDQYLPTHRLYFGRRAMEVRGRGRNYYASMVSVKQYGQQTAANMLDTLLQLPFELTVTQSFHFIDKNSAISQMQLQQNKMIQSEDVAISQIAEISDALDDAMSGKIVFGKHHLTVLCISENLKELDTNTALVASELGTGGVVAVREKTNLEPAYWAQLPGNGSFAVRRATINSLNLASFAAFHNYPIGKEHNNHWGDCVTTLNTTSGTPYFFNFHVRDVGHTTIIGPTGTGKTVLMNFLCGQAQKFGCRMFFFDKDRGAEIFIRAIGGKYTIIDPSKECRFNPLQLPDTGENRNFLVEWLKSLVTLHGEKITTEDNKRIHEAVSGNYKLEPKDRTLSNIVPFLGIGGPDSLFDRIAIWHGHGAKASVFDNKKDIIDFTKGRVFGFEMAELLRDPEALAPVLLYLFHRIQTSLDGTPSMIVLDEAWALIDNPVFAPKIRDWLKVLRKLNCFVVFATQSVEDASKSKISDTLIQQTATQIFLPNLKATNVYRTHFMLTEREFLLIKSTDPGTRFFLLKQANDAVVARVDLSGATDIINVLSGGAHTVRMLDEIRKETGDDPDKWLPIFYQRARNA